ncbi:MAG: chemotaxis protein CheR [Gammaproteobacteria bacterium]|nr:MAG: chemotaxis protein CheR [Gammaproteobacteria bacterium]RKZ96309.1 MAG: chemotaxis protein CheR [Gammaproteobacteria bacterium]RKZ96711.1 MAG: chemotaxis protein CheR [Gammaproteobacteria bacterium]RLA02412.1 MAG: chemotaxis protein CheR [Gammaproteobacteria bacterium]
MTASRNREFEFTDASFERIRQFVTEHTGIVLSNAKKDMVYGRLSKRIRKGGFGSFDAFCDALEAGDEDEQDFMINAITTNLTAFFRENHHFEFLAHTVIPDLVEKNKHNKRIRIWSAGCSTGEEPYSIAMILKEFLPDFEQWDVKILATDLDANVVAQGQSGIYRADRIEGLPEERIKRWFKRGRGDKADMVKVSPELQQMISFKRLNLLHQWPMKGQFDFMFCRNVVIYFDKDTQRVLFERYADILAPDAHLFIGHSETLYKVSTRFDSLGHTIYRKNQ